MRENEEPDPATDKPRYLLPEGCSDLLDVILRDERPSAPAGHRVPASKEAPPKAAPKLPLQVTVPDPVQVADLAARLQMKDYRLVSILLTFKVFVCAERWIDFKTAAAVCESLGVKATKEDGEILPL